MMSANLVSPSNQMDWLTTKERFSDWYIRTQRLESFMVPMTSAAVLIKHLDLRMARCRVFEFHELPQD